MKTFRFIGKMILVALIIGFTTSCGDDDDDDDSGGGAQSSKLIKQIVSDDEGYTTTYSFTYDGNKLKSFKVVDPDDSGEFYLTYSGNTLTLTGDGQTSKTTLTSQGYISGTAYEDDEKYESLDYTYDANGYLKTYVWNYGETEDFYETEEKWTFKYSDGNRVSADYSRFYDYGDETSLLEAQCKYTYFDYENKTGINTPFGSIDESIVSFVGGFEGKAPKNLVSRFEIVRTDGKGGMVINYTYERDNGGYVTKITEKYVDSTVVYTITYY